MAVSDEDDEVANDGVILRAQNGNVIGYDQSGLTLRLSDRVIADIGLRLGQSAAPDDHQAVVPASHAEDSLHDVDAWDIRRQGDWLHFTARLPGAQGVRGFRRHVDGGAILGDAPGPVLGLLGMGGPRAALATMRAPEFPHHILAPADDIGAVGHAGVHLASETDRFEGLRECTHEALVAETLLHGQLETFRPLAPLMVRVETDGSASAHALAGGRAVENLLVAGKNLKAASARMGKKAKLLAVCLDYALEHISGEATAYRDGMLEVMDRVSKGLWALGYDQPLFVSRFETGGAGAPSYDVIEGQWELAWNHGDHKFIHTAPAYMFARDRFDRPTDHARVEMAEMTAAALSAGHDWACPKLMLAETDGRSRDKIRVTCRAEGPLQLGTGPSASDQWAILDLEGLSVTEASIAEDDPQAVILTLSGPLPDTPLRLTYGITGSGALHDSWHLESRTGRRLHRYALPAILPIRGGANA